jgi:hypothetical protein
LSSSFVVSSKINAGREVEEVELESGESSSE